MEPLVYSGNVAFSPAEPISLPFESASGGCIVRYDFVVDPVAPVNFAIVEAGEGGAILHTATDMKGECAVPANRLCLLQWEHEQGALSLLSALYSQQEYTLKYEVTVLPSSYLARMRRRHLVRLAESGSDVDALAAALKGLEVSATDELGRTALHGAASAGNTDAIAHLLTRRAPLDARSNDGRTPLLDACAHKQPAAVAELLKAGADPFAVDGCGRNALHLAAGPPQKIGAAPNGASKAESPGGGEGGGGGKGGKGADVVVRLLLSVRSLRGLLRQPCEESGAADGLVGGGSSTPLAHAAAAGHTACVNTLLEAGALPDEGEGRPLLAAARCGRLSCLVVLVQAGADPARVSAALGSALHVAAGAGHVSVVHWLCDALTAAKAVDFLLHTDGAWRSPLLCAAAGGHGASVSALLVAGSPIEQSDRDGNSPLLSACTTGDPMSVSALMEAGAKPRRRNSSGKDALCCAAAGGHLPLLPLLIDACSDRIAEAMVAAAAAGQARTTVALVELCPLPPPERAAAEAATALSSPAAAAAARMSACQQLLMALWRRCCEEHLAEAKATGGRAGALATAAAHLDFGVAAAAAAGLATTAAGAATAAADSSAGGGVVEGGGATREPAPSAAYTDVDPDHAMGFGWSPVTPSATAAGATSSGAELEASELEALSVTNIQELIRQELAGLEIDDDDEDDY